jgi:two-component system response regulator FixJ
MGHEGGSSTETVYIVDDDATFARGLARLVGAAGWKAEVCSCAEEFFAPGRVEPAGTGCVLLDVRMPGMLGPELYRTMLERRIDLPVIFLTGYGDVPTSVAAMKLGAVDFLEKPAPAERLVGAIRAALARHAARRQVDSEKREVEARVAKLTRREREVMEHVIAGRLNKQIAADLAISLKTVKAHRAKVMDKMEARSVAALVDMCRMAGMAAAAPLPRTSPEPFES